MYAEKIVEEDATIFVLETEIRVKGRITNTAEKQKQLIKDVYDIKGKKVIEYNRDYVEVRKLTPIEKIYYRTDNFDCNVWKGVETLEILLKAHYREQYEFWLKFIDIERYNYRNWQSVTKGYGEYYTRWSNILIKDKEEFELLKDIYQIYSPVYCHQGGLILHGENNLYYLFKQLRKSKVERINISYTLFNDMYLKDRVLALETLFQEPIEEENLIELDKRISKGEKIEDLYKVVKIYPYITIEECLKGNTRFKTRYTKLKNKLEVIESYDLLDEIPFDNNEVDNNETNKQYDVEYEELVDINEEEQTFEEGRNVYRLHRTRERNPKVIKISKDLFKKNNDGRLFCEVCGFDFEMVYGKRGKDFIEAHHQNPVSKMKQDESTKIKDMRMVCPNCHRMLHKNSLITIEELKLIMLKQK